MGVSTISLTRLSYKKYLGSLTEVKRKAFDGISAVGGITPSKKGKLK